MWKLLCFVSHFLTIFQGRMAPKHGYGVSHDPRRIKTPFVARIKCSVTEKSKVVGCYSTAEEAQIASDKAFIKRYLQFGVHVKRLNNENMRGEYMEEIKQELLSMQPVPRQMVPKWFLTQADDNNEVCSCTVEGDDIEFTHKEMMEILESLDEL
jgi:hypothetical protein